MEGTPHVHIPVCNNKEEEHLMVFTNIKPLPTQVPVPRPLTDEEMVRVMHSKLDVFAPKFAPKTPKLTVKVDNNGWGKTFDTTNVQVREATYIDMVSSATKKSANEKKRPSGKKASK